MERSEDTTAPFVVEHLSLAGSLIGMTRGCSFQLLVIRSLLLTPDIQFIASLKSADVLGSGVTESAALPQPPLEPLVRPTGRKRGYSKMNPAPREAANLPQPHDEPFC